MRKLWVNHALSERSGEVQHPFSKSYQTATVLKSLAYLKRTEIGRVLHKNAKLTRP